ncbi:MAG: excinuclease ABC subunit B, partial [Ulvibacter sp.]
RERQIAYNQKNNITPTAIKKSFANALTKSKQDAYSVETAASLAAEKETEYLSKPQIEKKVRDTRKAMEKAAKDLDFMMAAKLRDKIKSLQNQLEKVK